MRQILITILLPVFSLAAHAELPGPVLTPAQKKLVEKDPCAQTAVDAATSAFVGEIKAAGVDLPEQIFVANLVPVHAGKEYSINFAGGDSTFHIETQMGRAACRFTSIETQ
jgi:hypothetical protein